MDKKPTQNVHGKEVYSTNFTKDEGVDKNAFVSVSYYCFPMVEDYTKRFSLNMKVPSEETEEPHKYFQSILPILAKFSEQQWKSMCCVKHEWIPDVSKKEFPKDEKTGKYLPIYCTLYYDHVHEMPE